MDEKEIEIAMKYEELMNARINNYQRLFEMEVGVVWKGDNYTFTNDEQIIIDNNIVFKCPNLSDNVMNCNATDSWTGYGLGTGKRYTIVNTC